MKRQTGALARVYFAVQIALNAYFVIKHFKKSLLSV